MMKKVLLLLALVSMLFACSGDDEDTTIKDEFSGTAWEHKRRVLTADITVELMFGYEKGNLTILKFFDSDAGADFDTETKIKGKYEYKHPVITFVSESGDTFLFTVNDERTELTDENDYVYKKWSR